MILITEELVKNAADFRRDVGLFQTGQIDLFKSFGSAMGVYGEGSRGTYMVRPRTPGGMITLDQFKAIAKISKNYGITIRLTTRQDIQLHHIKLVDLPDVVDDLLQAGLTTRGAGGDGTRNIACSPLSGAAPDEVFDVTPYMEKATNHLMGEPGAFSLPRKLKIAFSNTAEDTANATIADLGFIARVEGGKRGFEVYIAGGLGGGARPALKIEEFIEASESLYYVQAVKELFEKEGDRTNRHKARLRFVLNRLGEDNFVELFNKYLQKVKSEKQLDLKIEPEAANDGTSPLPGEVISREYEHVVFPQKQGSRYALYLHPQGGSIEAEDLKNLLNFLQSLDYEVSIRLTMTQGFFLRDLKDRDLNQLIQIAGTLISPFNIGNSVSCVGATVCNPGLLHSRGLLADIKQAFRGIPDSLAGELPVIHISGCTNSCGQHQIGEIGFSGRVKKTDDGLIPAYTMTLGGKLGQGTTKFGAAYGDIPAKSVAAFLIELAKLKRCMGENSFTEFINTQEGSIRELISKYASLPGVAEALELYMDFGSEEMFSVGKK